MIALKNFLITLNNMYINKKERKLVTAQKNSKNFLNILVQLNIVKYYKFTKIKNKNKIYIENNKTIKLVLYIKNKPLCVTKKDLIKLQYNSRGFYIISTSSGLILIKPTDKINSGGVLICKIIL